MNYFAHDSAIIDEPAHIGEGTIIWYFSHVMAGAQIEKKCNIGQNDLQLAKHKLAMV
jgi:UDP-2-acetamido-3-amino-2,3-dideoxy-glucuronate N-acetyltransferase